MRRSKTVSAFALAAGVALVVSACGGGGGGEGGGDVKSMATAKGQQGENYSLPANIPESGEVTVSTDNPFTAYNNSAADANNSYNTFALVGTLTSAYTLDGNNNVLLNKDVMESVEITNENPQEVTWKIKPGVKWSDGEAWDCDDFHLAWLSQSGKHDGFVPAATNGYEQVSELSCPNDTTVVAKFDEPYVDYKAMFGVSLDVLPAHILEQQTGIKDITKVTPSSPKDQLKKVADFWNKKWNGFDKKLMPGSGPYMLDSWKQNESVTLVRNPQWKGNKPGPEKITLKALPDPTAQAQALENQELQVVSSTQPDADAAERLKGLEAQGVTYGSVPSLSFEHLDMNYKNPIFKDDAVRKAFFQCVDRQEIVDKLIKPIQGDAKSLNSIVFFGGEQGFQDNYSDKADVPNGAKMASQTLEKAGWKKGGDGVYAKDGKKLQFRISHTDIPRRKQTAELIMDQCKDAGMKISDDMDPNFLDARVSEGDYDVALFAWSQEPFKASQRSIYSTGGGQNWSQFSDPKVDQAFKKATTQTSEEDALPHYQQADKALAENYYTLPLFQMPSMWAFQGVDRVFFQSYYGSLWNAGEWERTE
ncbi:MAG: ABC transporter family substrate-binding protein [Pseudonocardiaceae bacterium]|nr:ABC transporter family substrate-binding protein [Pseudonocardiaceae bacterium]